MPTSRANSFDNMSTRLETDAPNTLRMPISLMRSCAVKEARPKSPRLATEDGEDREESKECAYLFFCAIEFVVVVVEKEIVEWPVRYDLASTVL